MANKERLIEHVQFLCDELNQADIRDTMDGKAYDWTVDESSPDMTFLGGFCHHPKALQYLKDNNYLNMGVCPFCGVEPIQNRFTFTDTRNRNISFFICESCHSKGKKQSIVHAKSDSSCFIATSCYGSIHSPEVMKFRDYRDTVLLKSLLGRQFVKIYYTLSPSIAHWMDKREGFRHWMRIKVLDKIYNKLK